jgi:hypothetical protein
MKDISVNIEIDVNNKIQKEQYSALIDDLFDYLTPVVDEFMRKHDINSKHPCIRVTYNNSVCSSSEASKYHNVEFGENTNEKI